MGVFIIAALIAMGSVGLAFFWGFAESMATAPQYDNMPNIIFVSGLLLAAVVASSYWWG